MICIHHRSKVEYTENWVESGLGKMNLSKFEEFLHQNSVENRVDFAWEKHIPYFRFIV